MPCSKSALIVTIFSLYVCLNFCRFLSLFHIMSSCPLLQKLRKGKPHLRLQQTHNSHQYIGWLDLIKYDLWMANHSGMVDYKVKFKCFTVWLMRRDFTKLVNYVGTGREYSRHSQVDYIISFLRTEQVSECCDWWYYIFVSVQLTVYGVSGVDGGVYHYI